jgi:hypothetical protein
MISIADILFIAGVACALAGCWLRGIPDFVVGCGIGLCLAGIVVGRIRASQRRRGQ